MSTKFSIRPAPRKRPWICKRSPPCLVPTPHPNSLMATFSLQKTWPPPLGDSYSGTFLVEWRTMLHFWKGSWRQGSNGYTLDFHHNPLTGWTTTNANWDLGGTIDWGIYEQRAIALHPNLYYESWNVSSTIYRWIGQLVVTA